MGERQEDFSQQFPSRGIDDFIGHVGKVGKSKIYEEYQYIKSKLPSGTFQNSRHPSNQEKNRYKSVPCFDHSRVKLDVINENQFSDYIHANYVDGFLNGRSQAKHYICSQGPLENTAFDFWRMVLQEKVEVIVMVTRCVDNGKQKCFQYWPSQGGTLDLEYLRITNSNESMHKDYVTRDFVVHDRNKNTSRHVKQLHVTSWPDLGVPDSASSFLDILRRVREIRNTRINKQSCDMSDGRPEPTLEEGPGHISQPIIVHCSAGCGRSGTLIASDISVNIVEHDSVVNIPSVVRDIRGQRACCIETEEQYAFCYSVVLEFIRQKKMRECGQELGDIEGF